MLKLISSVALALALASPAVAEADAAKGERLFKRCAACHGFVEGKNKLGPSLYGMFGRTAGSVEGFRYSKAMKESGIVWDEETVSAYLENPRAYIKGNRMAFPGLKKPADRADIIAYLKTAAAAK